MSSGGGEGRSPRQWQALARVRVRQGQRGTAIADEFVQQGLDPAVAGNIADDAMRAARSGAVWLLVFGIFFALLGVVVTVVECLQGASRAYGGTYLIWFGPVLFGGIVIAIALRRLSRFRR